jgi:hypothetical protein
MNIILQNGKIRVENSSSEKTRGYAQKPRQKMHLSLAPPPTRRHGESPTVGI